MGQDRGEGEAEEGGVKAARFKWEEMNEKQRRMVAGTAVPAPDVEPGAGNEPLAAEETARLDGRLGIVFRSYRHRLADPDGLCGKYVLDSLVSCGVFKDDSARYIQSVAHKQVKVPTGKPERTVIIAHSDVHRKGY